MVFGRHSWYREDGKLGRLGVLVQGHLPCSCCIPVKGRRRLHRQSPCHLSALSFCLTCWPPSSVPEAFPAPHICGLHDLTGAHTVSGLIVTWRLGCHCPPSDKTTGWVRAGNSKARLGIPALKPTLHGGGEWRRAEHSRAGQPSRGDQQRAGAAIPDHTAPHHHPPCTDGPRPEHPRSHARG